MPALFSTSPCPTVRRAGGRAVAALAVLVGATTAGAQPAATVTFEGRPHTAIGTASLRLDAARNALVTDTASAGDGVAVRLDPRTTSFTAHHVARGIPGRPLDLTWTAVAEGRPISGARLMQKGERFALTANFTGAIGAASTYAIHVYDNGRLVTALGNVPPTAHILIPISWCQFTEFFDCGFVSNFHNTADQQCGWMFRFPSNAAMAIELPNGTRVAGTQIVLLEEVRPAGQYPYLSFDGLLMQTTAESLTLLSESVR